jgi:hypothetical protein
MGDMAGARTHGAVAIAVAESPETVPLLGTPCGRVAAIGYETYVRMAGVSPQAGAGGSP